EAPSDARNRSNRPFFVKTKPLADLAPNGKSRAALLEGISFVPLTSDDAVVRIARLAGLPEPLDRYTEIAGEARRLFFFRVMPAEASLQKAFARQRAFERGVLPGQVAALAKRPAGRLRVFFRDSIHLFDIAREQLLHAIVARLYTARQLVKETSAIPDTKRNR